MSSFKFLFFGWLFASQKTGYSGFRYRSSRFPRFAQSSGHLWCPYYPCHCLKLKTRNWTYYILILLSRYWPKENWFIVHRWKGYNSYRNKKRNCPKESHKKNFNVLNKYKHEIKTGLVIDCAKKLRPLNDIS